MDTPHLDTLRHFDEASLPDLDVVVMGALELLATVGVPAVDYAALDHPLVIGSGNAEVTGRIIFADADAIYADEGTYAKKLRRSRGGIQNAVIISASGKKHAEAIARDLSDDGITLWLMTNNPDAPAAAYVAPEHTLLFPRNREPYTYNTSTYMSMLLSKTKEDPVAIHQFIIDTVAPAIPDHLDRFDAFYFILPPEIFGVREMLLTKFDELFGPQVSGRVFTFEQSKHAKTVVPSETECFVSFGEQNEVFGAPEQRLHIPLPEGARPVAMMAIGYYVIGHIQKQHPPYFKERLAAYMEEASALFGHTLRPIVE